MTYVKFGDPFNISFPVSNFVLGTTHGRTAGGASHSALKHDASLQLAADAQAGALFLASANGTKIATIVVSMGMPPSFNRPSGNEFDDKPKAGRLAFVVYSMTDAYITAYQVSENDQTLSLNFGHVSVNYYHEPTVE